jgi:hypothetical protein
VPGYAGELFVLAGTLWGKCSLIWRISADGGYDASFGTNGFAEVAGQVTDVRPLTDGGVEVFVAADNVHGTPAWLTRLTAAGQRDQTFAASGIRTFPELGYSTGHFLPGGSALFIQDLEVSRSDGGIRVHRYSSAGIPDLSFGDAGSMLLDRGTLGLRGVRVWSADGGYLIGASTMTKAGQSRIAFFKLDDAGMPDPAFGSGGQRVLDLHHDAFLVGGAMQVDGYFMFAMQRMQWLGRNSDYARWIEAARLQVVADMVELYHPSLRRYLLVSDRQFRRMQESGSSQWVPTGERIRPGGTHAACAFRTRDLHLSGSTFYSVDVAECEAVARDSGWSTLESSFYATPSQNGGCAQRLRPVHRLYNNAMDGAANHRYVVDASLIPPMQDAGWTLEGVAFCVKP